MENFLRGVGGLPADGCEPLSEGFAFDIVDGLGSYYQTFLSIRYRDGVRWAACKACDFSSHSSINPGVELQRVQVSVTS